MLRWLKDAVKGAAARPPDAPAPGELVRRGLSAHQAGRLDEAQAMYERALALDPRLVDALHFLGVLAYQGGRHEEAERLIRRALALNAANAPAHNNLGNVLLARGAPGPAVAAFLDALALDGDYADAYINLGSALAAQGRSARAVACYRRALALAPDAPAAQSGLARALQLREKPEAASGDAIPGAAQAEVDRANALVEQGRAEDAIAGYRRALAAAPDFAAAYVNLGNVLGAAGRVAEAAACFRKALVLDPDLAEASYNLGTLLQAEARPQEAAACFERAIALRPRFAEAHYALGGLLRAAGRHADALRCYEQALAADPDYAQARWALAVSQIPLVVDSEAEQQRARASFARHLGELDAWFDAKRSADASGVVGSQQPFALAYGEENNRELLGRYGRLCARLMQPWLDAQGLAPSARRAAGGPVRVGVVSQYFWNHSVWMAIVKGWFGQIDRSRFALCAFALGSREDEETAFARAHGERFEGGARDLRGWVETILAWRPDVLLYPEIGMDPTSLRLASLRLAPVQVAAWGHPETTGLPTIDCYLSAEDFEPADAAENYTERLVALPHLGCFYEPWGGAALAPDLARFGVDADAPLLLCPGMPFKYAPRDDGILAEIAHRLQRCQLVFFVPEAAALSQALERRLRAAFAGRGLDPGRSLRFVPWQSGPAFDGWLERADVFLDSIGFSGFNTAMQAVERALPIVAREGRFMRGRFGAGILRRLGLDELVARSDEEYVAAAVRLARDAAYRRQVRERIAAARAGLFRDRAPIRALEDFLASASSR
jgi:predicted O-linked N-acetylglucosamine transferase (SPINDLY family)